MLSSSILGPGFKKSTGFGQESLVETRPNQIDIPMRPEFDSSETRH